MHCPCQDCPERKLTCHDRCAVYMEYHDALVEARESLKKANAALDFLTDGYIRRKTRSRDWRERR